jgi:hypothetical protein
LFEISLALNQTLVMVSGMELTKTQKAAFLHYIGKTPMTIQSNHQLNGETACFKKGLIWRKYSNNCRTQGLTEAGQKMAQALA